MYDWLQAVCYTLLKIIHTHAHLCRLEQKREECDVMRKIAIFILSFCIEKIDNCHFVGNSIANQSLKIIFVLSTYHVPNLT